MTSPSNELPTKSSSIFSMTESLARGLVARLISEWDEQYKAYFADKKLSSRRGVSALPIKRALSYRVLSERTRGLVPPGQRVFETSHGKQNGLDKTAGFAVIHWSVIEQTQRLDLLITYGRPGWRLPKRWGLFQVSSHALRRLFFRMKTLDQKLILAELEPAVRTVCAWYPLLFDLIEVANDTSSIGVPTPQGTLYLKLDERGALNSPGTLIAVTWISDNRMIHCPLKLAAVVQARVEGGIMLQLEKEYLSVTPQRNLHLLNDRFNPFINPFYQDMLKHLSHLPPSIQKLKS